MDLKFKIAVKNLNDFINNEEFILSLRAMTLNSASGMNRELDALRRKKRENGVIDAKAIVAYTPEENLGWMLFSRENSNCCYSYQFNSNQGVLIQAFVKSGLRRSGVGRRLLQKARRLAGKKNLCVIPWDDQATAFYKKNRDLQLKSLLDWVDL